MRDENLMGYNKNAFCTICRMRFFLVEIFKGTSINCLANKI